VFVRCQTGRRPVTDKSGRPDAGEAPGSPSWAPRGAACSWSRMWV